MNKTILNTGLWSASICLTSFIVWIISFTLIALQAPLFQWTNINDYVAYVTSNSQAFQYLAKSFMIVFSLAFMMLVMAFCELASFERKILAKIAVVFSIMFALVSSISYFAQITSVRFAIGKNEYQALEHFLQSNPTSFLSSVNMLGWTLFLGLSSIFLYLGLNPELMTKGLKFGLLANAFSCIFGGIGYLFQINLLTFVFMNLGIGLAFFMISISSIRLMSRLKKQNANQ